MSSILKALEKVEQSQNARRSGGPSSLPKSRQRRPAWVLPVGVIGGAALASLLTFAAMGGFSRHPATTAQPQPGPAVRQEAASVQPAPTAAAPQPKQTPAVAQKAPAAVVSPKSVPAPAAKLAATTAPAAARKTPVASAKSAAAAEGAKKGARKSAKVATAVKSAPAAKVVARKSRPAHATAAKKVAAVQSAPAQPPPAQPAPVRQAAPVAPPVQVALAKSRPEMRVTGIAWQKDSQSSAAIVNGRMVSQGVTVDGYRIEQIFEDKVRFSGKNGTVDVPLSAGE